MIDLCISLLSEKVFLFPVLTNYQRKVMRAKLHGAQNFGGVRRRGNCRTDKRKVAEPLSWQIEISDIKKMGDLEFRWGKPATRDSSPMVGDGWRGAARRLGAGGNRRRRSAGKIVTSLEISLSLMDCFAGYCNNCCDRFE
jgi:hypothetical protein